MADLRDLWTGHRPWPPNLLKSWFQIWCSFAAMDGALSHLTLDLKFVHLLLQIWSSFEDEQRKTKRSSMADLRAIYGTSHRPWPPLLRVFTSVTRSRAAVASR
ncbi:hypothetical protein NL676_001087 [Syzygium grande]|nr:hypothetical protein NL676_001087 [Syzygium grande]